MRRVVFTCDRCKKDKGPTDKSWVLCKYNSTEKYLTVYQWKDKIEGSPALKHTCGECLLDYVRNIYQIITGTLPERRVKFSSRRPTDFSAPFIDTAPEVTDNDNDEEPASPDGEFEDENDV